MTLMLVLKILGWICALVPLIAFLIISTLMIKGAGEDDSSVRSLTLIGFTIFLMGAVTLLVVYIADAF